MIHVLGTETKETEMIDDEDAPSGDDFNQPLRQLAQEAQRYPHESVPQRGLWSPSVYEYLYNKALQKTLLEVCRKN
ncbi:MAG: hypothetical protein BRC54_14400 [Cyanobacteria bacterium SW_7_48_12]|nr:MAG: hypothetical protein BRC54_14400 [Cyanobacteria bacterium SW_7_48_12]